MRTLASSFAATPSATVLATLAGADLTREVPGRADVGRAVVGGGGETKNGRGAVARGSLKHAV